MNENEEYNEKMKSNQSQTLGFKPTAAFIGASWAALGIGFNFLLCRIVEFRHATQ